MQNMSYDELPLKVNAAAHQLQLDVDGHIAFIDYKLVNQELFLIHTEVPDELRGKGIANTIIVKALQYAKDNNYKIVPLCPFVQAYLKRHPEWNALVAEDAQRFLHNQH